MKSQAVVWLAAGQVALEEIEVPDPGPGELLLEAECTLISPGTERAFLLNLPNTSGQFPQHPGYNFAGRVAAIGAGVKGWKTGMRAVAAAPHAAHVKVRAERAFPIPTDLEAESAVFFNMGSIALQGVRRAGIELGEAVAVLGQGLVGLLALQLARLEGGVPLIGVDLADSRLELSRVCGADLLVNPQAPGQLEQVMDSLEGGGPAVVIEATGAPESVDTALHMVRPAGRVVLLGSTRGETLVNFYREVHRKGISVVGAHNAARPFQESRPGVWTWEADVHVVLELLRCQRLEVSRLITHRVPAVEATRIYGVLIEWDAALIGAILQWN